jgi:hypothetical protein
MRILGLFHVTVSRRDPFWQGMQLQARLDQIGMSADIAEAYRAGLAAGKAGAVRRVPGAPRHLGLVVPPWGVADEGTLGG